MTHVEKLKKLVEIKDQLGYIAQLLVSTFSVGQNFKMSENDETIVDELYAIHFERGDGSEPGSIGYVDQDQDTSGRREIDLTIWSPVINTIDFPKEMHRFEGMSEREMNRLATVGVRDGAQIELIMKHDHDRIVAEKNDEIVRLKLELKEARDLYDANHG